MKQRPTTSLMLFPDLDFSPVDTEPASSPAPASLRRCEPGLCEGMENPGEAKEPRMRQKPTGDIPRPAEGQEWTIEASERQGLPRSPRFHVQLPSSVILWLRSNTSRYHDDAKDHIQDRLHWIVDEAMDNSRASDEPPTIPGCYFSQGDQWKAGRITLDAEHTYHVRLWARRMDADAGLLLAALICQAHHSSGGDPIKPRFTLELM